MMKACDKCIHFHKGRKECRQSPPVRLPRRFDKTATSGNRIREETLIWGWPTVEGHDWCGAFAYNEGYK